MREEREREKERRKGVKLTFHQGNDKLNLAFVADLFNKHSGLELPTLEEMERLKKQNSSMSKILDEAEARFVLSPLFSFPFFSFPLFSSLLLIISYRLRQILADGQLAHELQQEEVREHRHIQSKHKNILYNKYSLSTK